MSNGATTKNQKLLDWVDEVAALCQPDRIHWCDGSADEYDLAPDALAGSIFRMVRQGQRVIFDLDGQNRATRLRLGSEVDMGTHLGPPPVEP